MKTVDVLLAGKLLPGADPGKAIAALAKMTGQPPDRTLALLTSGKPRLFRAGLNQDQGEKMVRQFAELGIAAIVQPSAGAGPTPKATPAPGEAPQAPAVSRPVARSEASPKAAPQAEAAPQAVSISKPAAAPKTEDTPKAAPKPAPETAVPPAPERSGELDLGRPAVPTPFSADYDSLTLERPEVPSPTVVAVQPPDQSDEELDLDLHLEESQPPAPPERPPAEQEAVESEDSVRKSLKIEKESPADQETAERETVTAPPPEPEEELNPYTAPKADLREAGDDGEWADSATVVPAMSAVEWLRDAWLCLAENPKVWAQIILGIAGLFVLAFSLHTASGTLTHVVCPLLAAHLALLVYRQTQGFPITVQDGLLATKELKESVPGGSYRRSMLRMLGIGLLSFLYSLLTVLLCFLLVNFKFVLSLVTGGSGDAAISNSLLLMGGALLLYLLLQVLLFPLAVFSPTLVAVADRGVFATLRQSLAAALKNWQALGVLLAACFFAAVVSAALALLPGMVLDSSLLTAILSGLLFGCLWSFFSITGYFATQDVFGEEE